MKLLAFAADQRAAAALLLLQPPLSIDTARLTAANRHLLRNSRQTVQTDVWTTDTVPLHGVDPATE